MLKINKLIPLFLTVWLTCCNNSPNDISKVNLNNSQASPKSNQGPNSTGGLPQGPNSTGSLFIIHNQEGQLLTNTKLHILSEKDGALNEIASDIETDNTGKVNLENILSTEFIKEIKDNKQKIIIFVIKDGKEISTKIKNIKFISDKMIEVEVEANIPVAKKVNVSNKSINVVAGKQATLSADVEMSDGNKSTAVVWSSSDESVAVAKDGIISGLKQGVVVITVSTIANLSVNTKVLVTVIKENFVGRVNIINPKDKSIITEPISIGINKNMQLEALDIFDDGTTSTNIIWKSSDETILSVGRNSGLILGIRQGSVTVTATSTNDIKKSATIEVNVL